MTDSKDESKVSKGKRVEPVVDRMVKGVVAPPIFPMEYEEAFDKDGKPDIAILKEHFLKEGRLTPKCIKALLDGCTAVLKKEPNMLELEYPITVCGDVHGQFFDLVRLFEVGGDPKETRYLFLGDYVDRGCFSTECVFYLWALKITYPETFYLLRGNHECRQLTSFFNFKHECQYKYDLDIYEMIMKSMDHLPLSANINNSFFCVHGGLSPDLTTMTEIQSLERFQETPKEGAMCDLLWSDPFEEAEEAEDSADSGDDEDKQTAWFGYNDTRQCSYVYGVEAVKHFLKVNKLTSIIRAHEAQVDGYKMHMVNSQSGIPRVITIFSAPNYCDVYKNKAAVLKFDNAVLNIKQYIESPHPYYLPNFMDVFQWSLPFVAEKVTDMLMNVLDYDPDPDSDQDDPKEGGDEDHDQDLALRKGLLKKKVMAVTKVLRMYRVLRENNEGIAKLKQLNPSHKIPLGVLAEGAEGINKAISSFERARAADLENEVMPGTKKRKHVRRGSVEMTVKPTGIDKFKKTQSSGKKRGHQTTPSMTFKIDKHFDDDGKESESGTSTSSTDTTTSTETTTTTTKAKSFDTAVVVD